MSLNLVVLVDISAAGFGLNYLILKIIPLRIDLRNLTFGFQWSTNDIGTDCA